MWIQRLYLYGYKRIALSGVSGIDIDTDAAYQIILGTNGSGKSSLIQELSPLPANSNDYYRDGVKYIALTHRGHNYELRSDLGNKPKHSFIKDGTEQNESGTVSIQRQLVYNEFGIDNQIREIISGGMGFSQLTPAKRREIITRISDQDLTYAFSLYKKVASIARDQQGALKHTRSRITQEQEKIKDADNQVLEEEVEQLQNELRVLMENVRRGQPKSSAVSEQLHQELSDLEHTAEQILKHPIQEQVQKHGLSDFEHLETKIGDIRSRRDSNRQLYHHYLQEYERLEKLVGELSGDNGEDLETLRKRRKEYQEYIDKLRTHQEHFTFDSSVRELIGEAKTIKSQLVEILSELPADSDGYYTKANYEKLRGDLEEKRRELERARQQLSAMEARLREMEQADHTQCPKCQHQFRIGVCEQELERKRGEVTRMREHVEKLEGSYQTLYARYQEMEEYLQIYHRLRSLVHTYPRAQNLFNYLVSNRRVFVDPRSTLPMIDTWLRELHNAYEIERYREAVDTLDKSIEQLEQLEQGSKNQVEQSLGNTEKYIAELAEQIRSLHSEHEQLQSLYKRLKHRQELAQELEGRFQALEKTYQQLLESHRNEHIESLISRYQNDLAVKLQKLREYHGIEKVLEDLQGSLNQLEHDYEAYKVLAQALSPSDGIIADNMLSFIGALVEQINDVIAGVYSYRLALMPCRIEKNELDYRFPLIVGEEQIEIDDIQHASDGQREIIDFAFKLIALAYLGFQDHPLYLDELGRHQDETHLANMTEYVKRIIESGRHSQLFMVQHYAVGHGAFTQASVCVLDRSNISVPSLSNNHVVFL